MTTYPETPDWAQAGLQDHWLSEAQRIVPKRFHGGLQSFENRHADHAALKEKAEVWAAGFTKSTATGLWLSSNTTGSGKTKLACCILWEVILRGYSGLFWNVPYLYETIKSTYNRESGETEADILAETRQADLLVLDDVGAERANEWGNERLYLIANGRYEDAKAIIVTSNLDGAALAEAMPSDTGRRVISRLCEMIGEGWRFPEEDLRRKH